MRGGIPLVVCWLLLGCQCDAPTSGSGPGTGSGPGAGDPGSPSPSAAREISFARDVSPRPEPIGGPGACHDPELARAFEALASCDYRAGVIDLQCPAWKNLHTVVADREMESQALVQLTLMRLLDHSEERVRLAATRSLSTYARQRSVILRLGEAFDREESPEVRAWITFNFHGAAPEARNLVLRALSSDASPAVRAKAAQRLNLAHFVREPQVRRALLEALQKDTSDEVRKRAAESLGHAAGDEEVEKALLGCLPDPGLGPHCGIGLGRLGTEAGYQALLAMVRQGAANHAVHPLSFFSLVDFAQRPFFSAAAVRPLLFAAARNEKMPTGARHYAVKALGRLGREVPGEKARVLGFLRPLAADPQLGVSVRAEIEQLQKADAQPRVRAP